MAKANVVILRAATSSPVKSLAGSIMAVLSETPIEVDAMGAGAVNQAAKAIAMARSYCVAAGYDLNCNIKFKTADVDGSEKSLLSFELKRKDLTE